MKIYTLVPVVILALVIVGGYFIAPAVEAPQSRLDRQVAEKVELAQRLLNDYNGATPQLQKVFESASTRTIEVDPNKWQAYLELAEGTPFGEESFALRDRLSNQEQALSQAARALQSLGGSAASTPTPGAEEAYQAVLEEARAGHAILDQAIGLVRSAINLQEGEGESSVSGRDNPSATRLEALLLHHKADLLRREAAMVRAKANLDRKQVERLDVFSREIHDRIAAQQMLLTGGTAPGKTTPVIKPKPPADATEPAAAAPAEPTADRTPRRSGGLLGNLMGMLGDRLPVQPRPSAPRAPEPAQPAEPASSDPAVADAQAEPEVEQGPAEAIPSLPQRIANLQQNREQVVARISATQAEIQRLTQEIEALEARCAAADQAARAAQLKMFEAEQKGANLSDPEAVQRFINDYRKLSEEHRAAAMEATRLREGSVRNGRSASADPDEIMTSPIVPEDDSKPMEPERGLAALQADRHVAEQVLTTSQELLAEVDRQLAGLNTRRQTVESQLSGLRAREQELAAQLTRYAQAAATGVVRADQLEAEAIEIIDGPGQAAAGRAQSAAGSFQREVASFLRRENPTETPERKLSDMAADQFFAANAAALPADFQYLLARTYVQRAADLEWHKRMLDALASIGVAVKLDPQAFEGMDPEAFPASATSAQAAGQAVEESYRKAAEAAKQALDQYAQAATQAKEWWILHAQMAALHRMLADLPRVEGDTEDHLAAARQTYARAIQGREQRPEYAAYRRVLDSLKEAPGTEQ